MTRGDAHTASIIVTFQGRILLGWGAVLQKLLELLRPFLKSDRNVANDISNLKSRWNYRVSVLNKDPKP